MPELNVRMKVAELLKALKANRIEHIELHKKAVAAHQVKLTAVLKKAYEKAEKSGQVPDRNFLFKYPIPESYVSSFDKVIDMLEHDIRDEIELSQSEFSRYMRNEWDWSNQFAATNSTYLAN